MTEEGMPSLGSKQQRIAAVSLYYLQARTAERGVWSHDIHRWQVMLDPKTAVAQPSLLAILNRFELQGIAISYWERFTSVVRRPPRKFHHLTPLGDDLAVHAIQVLRTDRRRPTWIKIPEVDGVSEPDMPEGFTFTAHEGELVEA